MVVKATVLYPNDDDATFDMNYYLKTHMPLVSEKWQQYGLKGWEVIQFEAGADKVKPTYSVQATLIWDSADDLGKAVASPEAKEVFADVPNFSNKQPLFVGGNVLASRSH